MRVGDARMSVSAQRLAGFASGRDDDAMPAQTG
jgi:hypothetical protein